MFQSARLKLTAWYLLIIMLISVLFSAAIYSNVTRQIEGLIHMQNDRVRTFEMRPPPDAPPFISAEELKNQEQQLCFTLFLINLGIFVLAGGASYFLAGRTLRPIKLMLEEQNQFISNSSHELRTPIATMRAEMEANLLEKHISEERVRKLIKSNLEELKRLQNLSNGLLQLTQFNNIDNHKFFKKIPLAEIIQLAFDHVTALAKKKNISFLIDLERTNIVGDKSSLIELFTIFFDNAIKYSLENSKIEVSAKKINNAVKITIKDTGVGISQEDLPHIFERFYRADKSRSQCDGYGLGLSIAKTISEMHHATITVESEPHKGTIFLLQFPA